MMFLRARRFLHARSQQLGARLWQARNSGHRIEVASAEIPTDELTSYKVQSEAVAASGHRRAGWKVGSTSSAAQKFLGTNGPGSSPLLEPFCHANNSTISLPFAHEPELEGEFVLRYGTDLPARPELYSLVEVLSAIDAVAPGLEVVGSRRHGGLFGQGPLMVNADFGTNMAFTHGEWQHDLRLLHELADTAVTLRVNGESVAEGTGALALGSPLNVAVWLANHLSQRGIGVRAGEIVSTGTCTGLQPVKPGDNVEVDFGPLGTVHASFIADT